MCVSTTQVNKGPSANAQTVRDEEQGGRLTVPDADKATDHSTSAQAVWADVAVQGVESSVAPHTWQTVSRTKSTPRHRLSVRVQGAKELSESTTVRSIPRAIPRAPQKSVLAAYVGRLHIDTTEEDLTHFSWTKV